MDGKKRLVMLLNFSQLMNARWLRRLTDLIQRHRTSLKYQAGSRRTICFSAVGILGHHSRGFPSAILVIGASGEYAISLATVVAFTLTGSWIAALYILPALTVWLLGRSRLSETSSSTRVQSLYASTLHIAVRISVVVVCACFALAAFAVTQFKWLPKQMFPLIERNQFLIYMNMPDGTDISQTETRASEISIIFLFRFDRASA
jgi:hypothetical protein